MDPVENSQWILISGVVATVGILASVAYYFARYFFSTKPNDPEAYSRSIPVGTDPGGTEKQENQATGVLVLETMSHALRETRESIWGRIKRSFSLSGGIGSLDRDVLEEILYTSDMGGATAERLLSEVDTNLPREASAAGLEGVKDFLKEKMSTFFDGLERRPESLWRSEGPTVWLVVGVNGVGKTTTIGKLAGRAARSGKKTLIVPGDTFRAAASDQLRQWAERADQEGPGRVKFFDSGADHDPSGVAYQGVAFGKAQAFDLVIVDTAGRLHTQTPLMEELKKIKRVLDKALPGAPHETLLVLDANSGQNALQQAKAFHASLELTGVVITKLDGTAKGGVVLGVAQEVRVPILFAGVGESLQALKEFDHREFVDSIFQ